MSNGPDLVKTHLMSYTNNKGANQPSHPGSLITIFIVLCLDSMIGILAISKVSRFWLASVAEQAGLNLTCSKIPEDTFSHDVVQILKVPVELTFKRENVDKMSHITRKPV